MENEPKHIGSQLDFVIGKPHNHPHPLDAVSDAELRDLLKRTELSEESVEAVMSHRGKFSDLLLEIRSAGQEDKLKTMNVLASTLEVATGIKDPRRNEDDPSSHEGGIPAHAKRPWFNG